MNKFPKYCARQLEQLDALILESQNFLKQAPEGTLRISTQRECPRYYWVHARNPIQGDYIKKKNLILAKQLAQKDYCERFLKVALKARTSLLETNITFYLNELTILHKQLSDTRQNLIQPIILPDSVYASNWEQSQNEYKFKLNSLGKISHHPITSEIGIETEKGELVRSKSEKIIADKLFKMNIPYIYEMPLLLQDYGYIFPDFFVLNRRSRETFYWEHFGMMDNSDYCCHAIKKISSYERNGIYQGRKLITSYETSTHILNTKSLEGLITEFLL